VPGPESIKDQGWRQGAALPVELAALVAAPNFADSFPTSYPMPRHFVSRPVTCRPRRDLNCPLFLRGSRVFDRLWESGHFKSRLPDRSFGPSGDSGLSTGLLRRPRVKSRLPD
jgi:hypothetical protein